MINTKTRRMKTTHFLLLALSFLAATGCNNDPSNDQYAMAEEGYGDTGYNDERGMDAGTDQPTNNGGGNVTLHNVVDAKTGMVSYQIPLPASWKIVTPQNPQDPQIVGPGGVKVFYRSGSTNTYSNDPNMQRSYQMAGQAMRRPMDISAYLQQDLVPQMTGNGFQLMKQYPIPQVAERNRAYSAKLFKVAPSRDQHFALGTEWRNQEGKPLFMIVNMSVSQGQNDAFWYTNMQALTADQDQYESAKRALLNGIINTQDNPQQIAAYNASEQQKANQSWSQHNTKMQQNQRNFDQQQATHRSTWDAINKASMDGYNSGMESMDHNQQQFTNYIKDEYTVANPNGQQYQVESGSNQYWMNNNGEYIPSNDVMYDPNADNAVNNQTWQEVEIVP